MIDPNRVAQLPATLDQGMSFLTMGFDREGFLWTGLQQRVEALVCLGIAVGAISQLLSREMWALLPGGAPYYQRLGRSAKAGNTPAP